MTRQPAPIAVIVNPKSAGGKTARAWPEIRSHLERALGEIKVYETLKPQHATELAASALRDGCKTLIVVGGDGTVNEVVNGLFAGGEKVSPDAALGIIPQGTGCDLCKTLSIPLDQKAAIQVISKGIVKEIDVQRISYRTLDGKICQRYGINVTSFGMGGTVAALAKRSSRLLGGKLAFIMATLITALKFRGNDVTLHLDGLEVEARIANVAVGNGQYHGSGMWVCPRASLDDGLLDVTVIRYASALEILLNLPLLYNGRIYEHPKVQFHRATSVKATSNEQILIEIDGEPLGRLPLEISVLHRAIKVYAGR